jgi:hypothetical protein
MIYEISKEIAIELSAKLVPHPVIYGPERAPTSMASPRIVIERDRDGGDTYEAPKARTPNPKMVFVRQVGVVLRVFGKSPVNGAAVYDHERDADLVVDRLMVALHKVVRARSNQYEVKSAGLLSAAAAKQVGLEYWPGAIYEVRLTIDRAVTDVTWTGAAHATASMGGAHGVRFGTVLTPGGDAVGASELPDTTTRFSDGS